MNEFYQDSIYDAEVEHILKNTLNLLEIGAIRHIQHVPVCIDKFWWIVL